MSDEQGHYERIGKKGRVWVPKGSDAATVLAAGEGEAAHSDETSAKPKATAKRTSKAATKRTRKAAS